MILFVDDLRDPSQEPFRSRFLGEQVLWAKSFREFRLLLEGNKDQITEIHLDYFLGVGQRTGLDCLYYIEQLDKPFKIFCHSSDDDKNREMRFRVKELERSWKK
jgi:hypothetical protein